MKKAPVWQGIDFSSNQSEWQIVWFFWDFWDWQTSTIWNPTHKYKKSWTYTVKLTLDFANKNIEHNEIEIVIE
jgi:PKD repeat protein